MKTVESLQQLMTTKGELEQLQCEHSLIPFLVLSRWTLSLSPQVNPLSLSRWTSLSLSFSRWTLYLSPDKPSLSFFSRWIRSLSPDEPLLSLSLSRWTFSLSLSRWTFSLTNSSICISIIEAAHFADTLMIHSTLWAHYFTSVGPK